MDSALASNQFDSDATPTLQVQYGGRRFPQDWDRPNKRRPGRVQRLTEKTSQRPLEDLISESIWKRLAWCAIAPEESERQTVVETYIRSLHQLDEYRDDVEELVVYACRANLEFRQERGETNVIARDGVLDSKLQEMLDQASQDWLPPKNVLDAKLVSVAVPIIRERLEAALTQSVAEFSAQFLGLLANLVDRQLFGLVEWLPNHCCSYHFFKQVVIQENDGASERVLTETFFDQITERDSDTGRQIIGKQQVERTHGQGRHEHRLARHQHEVMNAVRTSILNSQVVMPPVVQELVKVVPDWLDDFVYVIDGDIFRERIIEQDIRAEKWADVQVYDEPIIGCEPGVIIGPYVLTGWGPREVAAELERKRVGDAIAAREESLVAAGRRAPLLGAAAVALTLVALGLLVNSLRGNGGMLVSILATVTALGTLWQAAFDAATAQRNPTAALFAHCLTVTLGCQLLIAEWLVARWFMPLSWLIPLALAGTAIASYVLGRRFR